MSPDYREVARAALQRTPPLQSLLSSEDSHDFPSEDSHDFPSVLAENTQRAWQSIPPKWSKRRSAGRLPNLPAEVDALLPIARKAVASSMHDFPPDLLKRLVLNLAYSLHEALQEDPEYREQVAELRRIYVESSFEELRRKAG